MSDCSVEKSKALFCHFFMHVNRALVDKIAWLLNCTDCIFAENDEWPMTALLSPSQPPQVYAESGLPMAVCKHMSFSPFVQYETVYTSVNL